MQRTNPIEASCVSRIQGMMLNIEILQRLQSQAGFESQNIED